MRISHALRFGIFGSLALASIAVAGCAGEPAPVHDRAVGQGIVELRVATLDAPGITRVTVDAENDSTELAVDASGNFAGSVILPIGAHTVVARAYAGATLIGESTPLPVDIAAGVVTRVTLRILDVTQLPAAFEPILTSLAHPTTALAGASSAFSIAVIAPTGATITYAWTSDCADASFSAPSSATTTWSKPTSGACTIRATTSAGGRPLVTEFPIVVFPSGLQHGALDVEGSFIAAPLLRLTASNPACSVVSSLDGNGANASCPTTTAWPAVTHLSLDVLAWGLSQPGPLDIAQDCGGVHAKTSLTADALGIDWVPPPAGGLCIITAHAHNTDGIDGTVRAAIYAVPGAGMPASPLPTMTNMKLHGRSIFIGSTCALTDPPAACGYDTDPLYITGTVTWGDALGGLIEIDDTCFGPRPLRTTSNTFETYEWSASFKPTPQCTATVRATTLFGDSIAVGGSYN